MWHTVLHQTDKVNGRKVIVVTTPVVAVICTTAVTYASLEPEVILVPLHFNDEGGAVSRSAEEVVLEFLADKCRSLIISGSKFNFRNLPLRGQQGIDD